MEASCWVARKIVRSVASASSRARTEPGRPILKATLVKGKITTSRMGTIGRRTMSVGVRSEYSSITEVLPCLIKTRSRRTTNGARGEPFSVRLAPADFTAKILEHFNGPRHWVVRCRPRGGGLPDYLEVDPAGGDAAALLRQQVGDDDL